MQSRYSYILIFFLGVLAITLITPPIIWVAKRFNLVDNPSGRKIHQKPTPLLGGICIFLAVNIMVFLMRGFVDETIIIKLFWGSLMIVILGTIDDLFDLKAIIKLFFQVIIAIYISWVLGGIDSIQIYSFSIEFNQFFGILFQAIWFVVLINAFNLIDGIDGLCTGGGIISLTTILAVSLINHKNLDTSVMVLIIGVLAGFLIFNFNPAKIFLGDAGSMLIGFYVATLSVSEYKSVTSTMMLVVGLIAFLPLFDTFLAFFRRKINGESAFKADALHFHHRLMKKGYSVKETVLLIYSLMCIFAVASIFIAISSTKVKILILLILAIFTIFIIENFYLLSDKYKITRKIRNLFIKEK